MLSRLMKMQGKLWKSVEALEYFTCHQWTFTSDNTQELATRLVQEDKEVGILLMLRHLKTTWWYNPWNLLVSQEFNFDVSRIHWPTYLENYCLGVKQYCMKEDLAGLPKARSQMKRLVCWFVNFQDSDWNIVILFLSSVFQTHSAPAIVQGLCLHCFMENSDDSSENCSWCLAVFHAVFHQHVEEDSRIHNKITSFFMSCLLVSVCCLCSV